MPSNPRWGLPTHLRHRLIPAARRMRADATPAEAALWERLRRNRVGGFSFRRQHPIGRFIVDFCCVKARLVVEVDGGVHRDQHLEDAARQAFLEERGYRVLRFDNSAVLDGTDQVIARIAAELEARR